METHSRADTRGYDLFKALVALGLLGAIAILLLRGPGTAQVATPPATATPAAATPVTAPTVAQILPVLNTPDIFSDGSVTLRGTAAPGAVLAVLANGQQMDTVQAGPDGTWSYQGQLEPGEYTLTVQTLDAAGNVINEAAGVAASVPAPSAVPALEAPQIGAAGQVSLQGTAEPGTTVEVVSDGVSLGTATAGADGTWSLDTRLDPGAYDLVVRTVDAEGNVVNESAAVTVQVPEPTAGEATTVPAEGAAAGATLELPEALAAGIVRLTGTGQPGSRVEVLVDGVSAGRATVGANRRWNLDLELPTPGDYSIVLQTLDASGALVAESAPVALKILAEAVAEAAAAFEAVVEQRVLTLRGSGEPGAEVEIVAGDEVVGSTTVAEDGTWTFTGEVAAGVEELVVRFRDAAGQIMSETEPVAVADALAAAGAEAAAAFEAVAGQRVLTMTGTGEPGVQVEIVAGDEVVGSTTVAEDGTWTFTGEVAAGVEELVARFRNASGRVLSETAPVKVTDVLATIAAALPAFQAAVREGVLTLTGTGEPGAEVEIVAGDEVLGTVTVAEDGTWTFTGDVAGGVEELVARLRDAAGTVIAESAPVAVAEAAEAAAGAAAEAAAEAVAPTFEAAVEEGVLTVTGTGEPGAEVEIVSGDEVLGTVQVAEDGTWSFAGEVAAGVEELVARLRDAAGTVIAESEPVAVAAAEAAAEVAGAAAEAAAEAIVPSFEAVVEEGILTVTGTGEPGAEVEIVSGDQVLGTVPVAEDGTWTFTGDVAAGVEELVARLRDAAGRVIAESQPVAVSAARAAAVSTGRGVSVPTAGTPRAARPSRRAPEGQVYIVRRGDWLSSIADRLYRNAKAYPRIVAGTNLKAAEDPSFQEITDPDLIYPGQKLWLPEVSWSP